MDDDECLRKMENYLNNQQLSFNKQGNNNGITVDKEQLFQCLKMYMEKKKNNVIPKSSITNKKEGINSKDANDNPNVQSIESKPVFSSIPSTSINKDENNVDNIPIQQRKVDFNKLVEEQLAKGNYQPHENTSNEVKFKYTKKPKSKDKYPQVNSNGNKTYKYYGDNFKSNKEEKALIKEQKKHKEGNDKEENNQTAKQKIPREIIAELLEDNKETYNDKKKNDKENNTFLAFNAIKQVNALTTKNNLSSLKQLNVISGFQKDMLKNTETDDEINNNDHDEEEENAIHQILTQKKPAKPRPSTTDNYNEYIDLNPYSDENNNDQIDYQSNEEEEEDNDEEDSRDIYKIYSDQIYEEEIPSMISQNNSLIQPKKIIPKPSKIISKYFNNTPINKATSKDKNPKKQAKTKTNKLSTGNNNNKEPIYKYKPKDKVNELVKEKLDEVTKMTEIVKQETIKISQIRKQYEGYISKLQIESEEYEKKKLKDIQLFEKEKEEQIAKLEKDRKIHLNNTNLLENLPNKKDREEIDNLKEQILKLNYEKKQKEQKNTMSLQRLKKQIDDATRKNASLSNEIKVYETKRDNKQGKASLDSSLNKGPLLNVITESAINTKDSIELLNTNQFNNSPDDNYDNASFLKDDNNKETYEMIFLEKYHSNTIDKEPLLQQETMHDGKIINVYNTRKEILFPGGMRKAIYADSYQITYFHNNDIKQMYPNGKEVYLYAESNITQTKFPDQMIIFRFSNGNIEQIFPDGTKVSYDCDGNVLDNN